LIFSLFLLVDSKVWSNIHLNVELCTLNVDTWRLDFGFVFDTSCHSWDLTFDKLHSVFDVWCLCLFWYLNSVIDSWSFEIRKFGFSIWCLNFGMLCLIFEGFALILNNKQREHYFIGILLLTSITGVLLGH